MPWLKELIVQYFSKSIPFSTLDVLPNSNWFSVIYITSGKIDFTVKTATIHLSVGYVCFVPNALVHQTIISPVQFYLISFTKSFAITNRIAKYGIGYIGILNSELPISYKTTKVESKYILQLIKLLQNNLPERKFNLFQKEIVNLYFNLLLFETSAMFYKRIRNPLNIHSRKEKIVMKFLELINKNSSLHHDVKFYADSLFISKGYLTKVIRNVMNVPAKHLIELAIISEAYQFLANENLTITNVAENLNFSNLSTFSSFFKKHTGISPTQYRLTLRQ